MTFGCHFQFKVFCRRFSYPAASIIIKTYHSRLHLLFYLFCMLVGGFKSFLFGRFHVCLQIVYVRLGTLG